MMAKDRGGLEQRLVGRQPAIGPHFQDQFVVIGALADACVFHRVLYLPDGREERIDRDDADGLLGHALYIQR